MARQAGTDNSLLAMALIGYEAQIAKINAAIAEIQAKLGHRGPGRPRAATAKSKSAVEYGQVSAAPNVFPDFGAVDLDSIARV